MLKLFVGIGIGGFNEFSLVEWFINLVVEILLGELMFFMGLDVDLIIGKFYGVGSLFYFVNFIDGFYEIIGIICSVIEDDILLSIIFFFLGVFYGLDYDSDLGLFRLYIIDINIVFVIEVGIVLENVRVIDFVFNGIFYGVFFDLIIIDFFNGSVFLNIGFLEVFFFLNDFDIIFDGIIYVVEDDYDIDIEIFIGFLYEINLFLVLIILIGFYFFDLSVIVLILDEDLSIFIFLDIIEIINNNELLSSLNIFVGDGSLRVNIDVYGFFGFFVEGDIFDVFYDLVDEIDEVGIMFELGVVFCFVGGLSCIFFIIGFIGDFGGFNNLGFF